MKRRASGQLEVTSAGGESVRAFVPDPLPPNPPFVVDGALLLLLERAHLLLGRLDSMTSLLPDPALLLYTYVRKEAVLSSQIEGTQSSLSELLLSEVEGAPGIPSEDVEEVSRYVAAMDHGIQRIRAGFPISSRLFREIHAKLLSSGRGSSKDPGNFRRSQNWIGGDRPSTAAFVPPPPERVAACMSDLERFLHAREPAFPVVIRAGLAHVQFETIHPFLDGNGRVGRLLITLLLCEAGVLREPLLYLSLYLKKNRADYYRLLDEVRRTGDWEAWMEFFLRGVAGVAEDAVNTTQRLVALFDHDRQTIQKLGRKAGSALRIHDALRRRPVLSLTDITTQTALTFPTVAAGVEVLIELGLARELTGRKRNRVFAYDPYLAILSEGTEPL